MFTDKLFILNFLELLIGFVPLISKLVVCALAKEEVAVIGVVVLVLVVTMVGFIVVVDAIE